MKFLNEAPALSLSDRMQYYENIYDNTFSYTNTYLIRLDGNTFSKRIKQWKLRKPFDADFHYAMVDTCKELINLIPNAKLIWTASDEITVLCYTESKKSTWFANRINKVVSLSAAYATAYFNRFMKESCINVIDYPGFFDARIISVPSFEEACNNILSRYNDCKRNSVSMYASSVYSHKELLNKNTDEKLQMLQEKNLDWYSNSVPNWSKYGTFIFKQTVCFNKKTKKEVTTDLNKALELVNKNKDEYYIRNRVKSMDLTIDNYILDDIEELVFN